MTLDALRRYCLSLPRATEQMQWGDHVVFKVAGKMFAVTTVDPTAPHQLSFKCDAEVFAELVERPGIVPAPYLARNHWVALEAFSALRDREIEQHIADSYRLVVARLPKKTQRDLADQGTRHPTQGTRHRAQGTRHRAQGTRH